MRYFSNILSKFKAVDDSFFKTLNSTWVEFHYFPTRRKKKNTSCLFSFHSNMFFYRRFQGNKYQLVLVADELRTFAMFNYRNVEVNNYHRVWIGYSFDIPGATSKRLSASATEAIYDLPRATSTPG